MAWKGDFFFKFKFGWLKTQRFALFFESSPLPNLDAQKKLAFRRRETPINLAGRKQCEPPLDVPPAPPRPLINVPSSARHLFLAGVWRLRLSSRCAPELFPEGPELIRTWPHRSQVASKSVLAAPPCVGPLGYERPTGINEILPHGRAPTQAKPRKRR